MKTPLHFLFAASLGLSAAPLRAADPVVPVPAIPGVAASSVYQLRVNGQEVAVNDESRFDFHTAAFCMAGTADVEIRVPGGSGTPVIRPLRHPIAPEFKDGVLSFSIRAPLKLVVEVAGQLPLALLATPLESGVPEPSAPNVLYFGPGIHEAGVIRPRTGEVIYLAPGALVRGRIEAKGVKDVAVKGRGILDAGNYS
ncbi:MAG TPA: hypothetical protein VIS74_05405, partial [Chthoniobacterales bacterium]